MKIIFNKMIKNKKINENKERQCLIKIMKKKNMNFADIKK